MIYTGYTLSEIFNQLGCKDSHDIMQNILHEYTNDSFGINFTSVEFFIKYHRDWLETNDYLKIIRKDVRFLVKNGLYDRKSGSFIVDNCLKVCKNKNTISHLLSLEYFASDVPVRFKMFSEKLYRNIMDSVDNIDETYTHRSSFKNEMYTFQRMYFDISNDRNITAKTYDGVLQSSYAPKGKETIINDYGKWGFENRIKSKLMRGILKAPFRLKYPNTFFEKLNNELSARMNPTINLSIIDGYDIVEAYLERSHSNTKNLGTLDGSCMRYEACSEYIRFYAENKQVVKLLVAKDEGDKIIGRALLWKCDDKTIMDRIYGSEITINYFKTYAKENGIIRKEKQTYDNPMMWVHPDTDDVFSECFDIKVKNIRRMPYMDTFKYTDDAYDDTMILNNEDGSHCFNDTDGSIEIFEEDDHRGETWCEMSDEWIDEDDAIYIDSRSMTVHERYAVYTIDDLYELRDDCVYLDYIDKYAHEENCEICFVDHPESARYEEYILTGDAIFLDDGCCLADETWYNDFDGRDYFLSGSLVEVEVLNGDKVYKYYIDDEFNHGFDSLENYLKSIDEDLVLVKLENA